MLSSIIRESQLYQVDYTLSQRSSHPTSNPLDGRHDGIPIRNQPSLPWTIDIPKSLLFAKRSQQPGWLLYRQSWQHDRALLDDVHQKHVPSTRTYLGLSYESFPESLSDSCRQRNCAQVLRPVDSDCGSHLRCGPYSDSQRQGSAELTSDRVMEPSSVLWQTQSFLGCPSYHVENQVLTHWQIFWYLSRSPFPSSELAGSSTLASFTPKCI